MRVGRRRRTNTVQQAREAASSSRPHKFQLRGVLHILSNGHDVQPTTVHRHTHVLGTEDSPVHEVAGALQRRAHAVELLAAANVQRIRHVLEYDNVWALLVDII